ncbi:MAG: hypothetical protein ACRCZ9_12265 [Fusobacteriaceae bacterium]
MILNRIDKYKYTSLLSKYYIGSDYTIQTLLTDMETIQSDRCAESEIFIYKTLMYIKDKFPSISKWEATLNGSPSIDEIGRLARIIFSLESDIFIGQLVEAYAYTITEFSTKVNSYDTYENTIGCILEHGITDTLNRFIVEAEFFFYNGVSLNDKYHKMINDLSDSLNKEDSQQGGESIIGIYSSTSGQCFGFDKNINIKLLDLLSEDGGAEGFEGVDVESSYEEVLSVSYFMGLQFNIGLNVTAGEIKNMAPLKTLVVIAVNIINDHVHSLNLPNNILNAILKHLKYSKTYKHLFYKKMIKHMLKNMLLPVVYIGNEYNVEIFNIGNKDTMYNILNSMNDIIDIAINKLEDGGKFGYNHSIT